jgi:hypothetical protein
MTCRKTRSVLVALTLLAAAPAYAEPEPAPAAPAAAAAAAAPAGGVTLELNKLEPYEKGCRTYMVVNNTSDTVYQSFKLDFVLFQPDGVISKRIALDLAPIKAQKRTVKLFELEGVACEKMASILINEVMECKTEAGAVPDCLGRISTSSLTSVQISK